MEVSAYSHCMVFLDWTLFAVGTSTLFSTADSTPTKLAELTIIVELFQQVGNYT